MRGVLKKITAEFLDGNFIFRIRQISIAQYVQNHGFSNKPKRVKKIKIFVLSFYLMFYKMLISKILKLNKQKTIINENTELKNN